MMETMKQLTVWECKWCKKLFRTPNRHYCKFNPGLKNCFTCKHLRGWLKEDPFAPWDSYYLPDCAAGDDSWDIELIKEVNYDMQCPEWEMKEDKDGLV
jgi:hypothetical protein